MPLTLMGQTGIRTGGGREGELHLPSLSDTNYKRLLRPFLSEGTHFLEMGHVNKTINKIISADAKSD